MPKHIEILKIVFCEYFVTKTDFGSVFAFDGVILLFCCEFNFLHRSCEYFFSLTL